MSRGYDKEHVVKIEFVPADETYDPEITYQLFHPVDCKTETYEWDNMTFEHHECGTGYEVENIGLEGLYFDPLDYPDFNHEYPSSQYTDDAWKGLPAGLYLIKSWHSGPDHEGEYDGGTDLIGSLDPQVDLTQWKGLDGSS